MKKKLIETFQEVFQEQEQPSVYFAPGRVNLIGEHTDYNGGHVFPCALTIGTYAAVRKREDKKLRFYSMNFSELGVMESNLDELVWKEECLWTNYPKGMIWAMKQKGFTIDQGMDVLIYGNIPNASGLSSSASLEVLTGFVVKNLFQLDISLIDLAITGQFAENNYNGVNCGIMDQFSVAMGKKDHAIFLDTSNLNYEYAPIRLDNEKIIIACSNKKRGLGDSKYNERRSECETALSELQKVVNIESLGELAIDEFEKIKDEIKDEVRRKRAKHAVYENQRTLKAVEALKQNDLIGFGQLMNESHKSLQFDYEVTGVELDTLVESAWKQKGVIGSRMTGAGFGGCTVSIVENDCVDRFMEQVGKEYKDKIGYDADFYVVQIGDGPVVL